MTIGAALAALLQGANPDLAAESVVKIIKKGCDYTGDRRRDIYSGCGRITFGKTMRLAKPVSILCAHFSA
jgi:hypothetical protein